MGFFNNVSHSFNKLSHSTQKFANKAIKSSLVAGKYLEKKALPAIEAVNSKIHKGLGFIEPIAAIVAPEALPFLEGARRASGYLDTGLSKVHKGIDLAHTVKSTVNSIKNNDAGGAISNGLKARKQTAGLLK
jgi:hypothetical protein